MQPWAAFRSKDRPASVDQRQGPSGKVPRNRRPISPGEVLREDFLETLRLTQGALAKALGVDRTSINELVNGRRAVTPEMALRLAHAFSTTPEYWLNLQSAVDLFDALHSPVVDEVKRLEILVPT